MSPARCNVERLQLLPLVLSGRSLIKGVRRLEPGTSQEQIQMERIRSAGLEVCPIKEAFGVADIVNGLEFGRVEEPSCSQSIHREKVAVFRIAQAKVDCGAAGAKRSVVERDAPGGLGLTKTRLGCNYGHQ